MMCGAGQNLWPLPVKNRPDGGRGSSGPLGDRTLPKIEAGARRHRCLRRTWECPSLNVAPPLRAVRAGLNRLRKNQVERFIPAGDASNSRGQRPRNACPRGVRPCKGRFRTPLCPPHGPDLCDPGGVGDPFPCFRGALPPAIKLRPSRARKGGEYFRSLPSPALRRKPGTTPYKISLTM